MTKMINLTGQSIDYHDYLFNCLAMVLTGAEDDCLTSIDQSVTFVQLMILAEHKQKIHGVSSFAVLLHQQDPSRLVSVLKCIVARFRFMHCDQGWSTECPKKCRQPFS